MQDKKTALVTKLERIARDSDEESGHVNADAALLKFINDPAISRAYHAIKKWYA